MKGKLAAVAVALLLFATGAAMAMPGDAPDAAQADDHSQADDHRPDDAGENASDAAGDQGPPMGMPVQATDEANGSQGPPVDLPDAVPDFVSQIHEAVTDHSGGSGLGDLISDLTPGDESDGDDAESDTESADAANATDAMSAGVPAGP